MRASDERLQEIKILPDNFPTDLVLPACTFFLDGKLVKVEADSPAAKYCVSDYSSRDIAIKIYLGYDTCVKNAPRAAIIFDYAKQLEVKYKGATELQGKALDTAVTFGDRVQESWKQEKEEEKKANIVIGLSCGAGGLALGLLVGLIIGFTK